MDFYFCPKCKSENTQKLSAIYSAGTSTSQSRSRGIGLLLNDGDIDPFLATSKSVSSNQTHLAEKLNPPVFFPAKCTKANVVAILGVITALIALGFFMSVFFSHRSSKMLHLTFAIISSLSASACLTFHNKEVKRVNTLNMENAKRIEKEMIDWNTKYYCHRCEHIFRILN
jgi:hypothetical protein